MLLAPASLARSQCSSPAFHAAGVSYRRAHEPVVGTNRPNEDVRIHGGFRRDNGHAADIAGRPNLTHRCHVQRGIFAARIDHRSPFRRS
jgi:hypothetical protein